MRSDAQLECPACGRAIGTTGPADYSVALREHFDAAHGSEQRAGARSAEEHDSSGSESGAGRSTISPDPSSLQTTENDKTAGSDARPGLDSHDPNASTMGKVAQGVEWTKGTMRTESANPTTSMTPPMGNMMKEKLKDKLGLGEDKGAADLRADMGRQSDRDRLLHTGPHASFVNPPGMRADISAPADVEVRCPLCHERIASGEVRSLNADLREHMERSHPLLESPIRS